MNESHLDILDIFTKNAKNYHDDIHGEFPIHEISVAIIDTEVFQRLLETKQAGKVKHVYHRARPLGGVGKEGPLPTSKHTLEKDVP